MIKLHTDYVKKFIDQDINLYQDKVTQIHQGMLNKQTLGSDFLGWLNYDFNLQEINRIKKLHQKYANIDVLVVVGIGGSYLGAKAGIEFCQKPFNKEGIEIIFAGFNLSSSYHHALLTYLQNKDFCINVISKSGTTTEPAIAFRLLKKLAQEKYGDQAHERIFATTDQTKGALLSLANDNNYEKFVIPDNIGGRYSVFTAVGLLPFVFAGLDIDLMISGVKQAIKDFSEPIIAKNLAYQYALYRYCLYKKGYKIEMLVNYEPSLSFYAEWFKQLFAESEGKNNQALFVASANFSTDLHSIGQYIQEGPRFLFETVIQVAHTKSLLIPKESSDLDGLNYIANKDLAYVNNQALHGALKAHTDGLVPNIIIQIDQLDSYNFGYLSYFFMRSCALSAYLLEVNPFDQPGVEAYKTNMFKLLGKK